MASLHISQTGNTSPVPVNVNTHEQNLLERHIISTTMCFQLRISFTKCIGLFVHSCYCILFHWKMWSLPLRSHYLGQ